jgi:epoxyqueuosine reductase QueG
MRWLERLLFGGSPGSREDEERLRRQISIERDNLQYQQRRAEAVLADFRRAEAVIRGDDRGSR